MPEKSDEAFLLSAIDFWELTEIPAYSSLDYTLVKVSLECNMEIDPLAPH